jgi:hypothetical protein
MPFVEGFLDEKITVGSGRPTHPIAPGGTTPPWGIEGPVDPGYGIPLPPVTVWPTPPSPGHPSHPIQPTYPVDPDYGLPLPPTVWPQPPVAPNHDLPVAPVTPEHPIYLPVAPNNDLPLPPGSVWPPVPPSLGDGQVMALVWLVGIGYRWTVLDLSLKPEHPIAPPAAHPSHPIAPGGSPGSPAHPIDPGGQPTPRR